jgi:predicted enzyme related to lactoylglutathione lyase
VAARDAVTEEVGRSWEAEITARLYRVIAPVRDIEAAARFYASVLGVPGNRVSPGRHYFECGDTILACYDQVADGDGDLGSWSYHPMQYLYFSVDDLDAMSERIREAGGRIEREPSVMPWGERVLYALDPFGTRLCFADSQTLFLG